MQLQQSEEQQEQQKLLQLQHRRHRRLSRHFIAIAAAAMDPVDSMSMQACTDAYPYATGSCATDVHALPAIEQASSNSNSSRARQRQRLHEPIAPPPMHRLDVMYVSAVCAMYVSVVQHV